MTAPILFADAPTDRMIADAREAFTVTYEHSTDARQRQTAYTALWALDRMTTIRQMDITRAEAERQ